MFTLYAISLSLIGLSGVLIDSHRRSWRAARQDETLGARERRFARSQYLRRMQASSIIGLVGAAIGVRPLIPPEPFPMAVYLATLVGACACIMLLALLDVWATRQHFLRIRDEQLTAEAKLAIELRRATRSTEGES